MITKMTKFNEENMQNAFRNFKEIENYGKCIVKNELETNLSCEFWANQINYSRINQTVFAHLVINTKTFTSTSEDDFYVKVPFTFYNNWFFPVTFKASLNNSYYLFLQKQYK